MDSKKKAYCVSIKEVNRRKKQSEQDKKNKPKSDTQTRKRKRKEHKKYLRLQKQFLVDVRQAAAQQQTKLVIELYEKQHGSETIQRLVKRCNIQHWT